MGMVGVREIELRRRRLNAAFERAERLRGVADFEEIQAEYARHLCVLISGFVERGLEAVILEYAAGRTARPLMSFIETKVQRLRNVDKERFLAIVGSLDAEWRLQMERYIADERQDALNSVIGLRNNIAHGGDATVSLRQVRKYWVAVQEILDRVTEVLLAPPPVLRRAGSRRPIQ